MDWGSGEGPNSKNRTTYEVLRWTGGQPTLLRRLPSMSGKVRAGELPRMKEDGKGRGNLERFKRGKGGNKRGGERLGEKRGSKGRR